MTINLKHQQSRYWIGVVSASHVKMGVQGEFAQLCHGKSTPLRRMSSNDWLIYYSPRKDLSRGEVLHSLDALVFRIIEKMREWSDCSGNIERRLVPTGVTLTVEPVNKTPREWAERTYTNIQQWTELPKGGHFAAFEETELLAEEIRAFFRPIRQKMGRFSVEV
ncbi:hypothetical protein BRE01_41530 [Brevibacillus reuszeri]|uniref:EVE domain-containing protein n=1 Tax=Brevibacillus reuszeri TaxID=54915 RepID=A0ABQ0TRH6_9BACL|nr:EVE domain-containing protein [Brevibacillus reuszeri]MED1860782.1 EVE domain-containing protein [Brevibacillus reuszeri]GED70451.1 hypothetical protein BRE01_41530 [Brevibacillus reuszeri]